MSTVASPRRATTGRPRPRRRPRTVEAARPRRLALEPLAVRWQLALDTTDRALSAASTSLAPGEVGRRRRRLAEERARTAGLLAAVADAAGVRPTPWLSPVPVSARMLGLPTTARACLFDLGGVLTDSGALHAIAWGEVFDEFLLRLSEKTDWQFIPFDRTADYGAFISGRQRLEGIHVFLASRGIRVPEGRFDDDAACDTACGLARRKGEAMTRVLRRRGVAALDGARRYLEAAGRAGLGRGVVSSSANALPMLELAGLDALVDARVDADVIARERLRSRPAPDLLLAACTMLDVAPEDAVTLTHSAAGVAAGRAAGLAVIAVADEPDAERLRGFGAERVVPSLRALLDRRLVDDGAGRL